VEEVVEDRYESAMGNLALEASSALVPVQFSNVVLRDKVEWRQEELQVSEEYGDHSADEEADLGELQKQRRTGAAIAESQEVVFDRETLSCLGQVGVQPGHAYRIGNHHHATQPSGYHEQMRANLFLD
jgi:hypothetical protein